MPSTPKKSSKAKSAAKSTTVGKVNTVDAILDVMEHPERALIDALRSVIARAVPAATESVKWNAPSFATAEHFATLHLRAKSGVQLILHLGAKARADVDVRDALPETAILEWKGADRAVVTVRDVGHLETLQAELTQVLKVWSNYAA